MLNVILHLLAYFVIGLMLYRALEEMAPGKDPVWMRYVFGISWFPTLVVFIAFIVRDSLVDWWYERFGS